MTATKRTRTGRPTLDEAPQIEARLRQAAVETFLEHGFDATTMDAVAKAAGITKRTLYAHYPDKRTLFANAITWAIERHPWKKPPSGVSPADLADALAAIARSTLEVAHDPDVVRLVRMGMTESKRFPDVATRIESLTVVPFTQAVVDLLNQHACAGTVVVEDVEIAADQFLSMVTATSTRLAAFGITRPPKVERRHLEHAVKLFLNGVLPR
ncbi:MAG TPA: TetR/AcrR family transcriptional regulator [Acidimicrobiales bacterium]|nr:TetR/AcrR family transcriptional regulator [Acidimicrobiales bacterium]